MEGFCVRAAAQRPAAAIIVTDFSLVWEQIVVAAWPGGLPAEGDEVPGLGVEADYHLNQPLPVPQPPWQSISTIEKQYCWLMPGYLLNETPN